MTRNHTDGGDHHTPREPQTAITSPEGLLRGWWKNHGTQDTPTPTDDRHPITVVWWWDAISYGTDNWTDHTDTPTPAPTITVGWLTHNTPQAVTITPLTNTHQWGNGITIPWGCIHHIHTIPHTDTPRRRPRKHPTT